jgi:hypothetical protein
MVGEVFNVSDVLPTEIVLEFDKIVHWVQALGVVVFLWIGFQAVTFFISRRNRNRMKRMEDNIQRVEKKLDKVLKRK